MLLFFFFFFSELNFCGWRLYAHFSSFLSKELGVNDLSMEGGL